MSDLGNLPEEFKRALERFNESLQRLEILLEQARQEKEGFRGQNWEMAAVYSSLPEINAAMTEAKSVFGEIKRINKRIQSAPSK